MLVSRRINATFETLNEPFEYMWSPRQARQPHSSDSWLTAPSAISP